MTLDISLSPSLMDFFPIYAVSLEEIIKGKICLTFAAKTLENIFLSTLTKNVGL